MGLFYASSFGEYDYESLRNKGFGKRIAWLWLQFLLMAIVIAYYYG